MGKLLPTLLAATAVAESEPVLVAPPVRDPVVLLPDPVPEANCPGRCWKSEKGKCIINADEKCSSVTCDHDKMTVKFDSDLFGVKDNQDPNPFGDNFKFEGGKWTADCPLGGCGMDAVCEDVNGNGKKEHIVFNIPVGGAAPSQVIDVLGKEVQLS